MIINISTVLPLLNLIVSSIIVAEVWLLGCCVGKAG